MNAIGGGQFYFNPEESVFIQDAEVFSSYSGNIIHATWHTFNSERQKIATCCGGNTKTKCKII